MAIDNELTLEMEGEASQSSAKSSEKAKDLLRDLEIESFSTSISLDVDECKKVYAEIKKVLSSTQNLESETLNRLKHFRSELLEEDTAFQDVKLQHNESERLFMALQNEKKSLKKRCENCKKAETIIKYEHQRIQPINDDLEKQAAAVRVLNDDIVRPVMEKKELEYKIIREEAASSARELEKAKETNVGLSEQCEETRSNYDEGLKLLQKRRVDENEIKHGQLELQRDFELMNKKVSNIRNEVRVIQEHVAMRKVKVLDETALKNRAEIIQKDVAKKLESQQERCNRSRSEFDSISKALKLAQTKYHSLTTARVNIEIKHKQASEHLRHKNAAALMQRKQLDRMMRLYLKKKIINEKSIEGVRDLKVKLSEDMNLIKSKETLGAEQYKTIECMKDSMNIKITRLLEQKHVEDEIKVELETIIDEVEEKEIEVDRWRSEVKKLNKIISVLSNQRDIQVQKTKNITSDEKDFREVVKLKDFIILDMSKVLRETELRTKEFGALYESLNREKKELIAASSASYLALENVKKQIEKGTVQLQTLKCGQQEKTNVLVKEKDSHENSKSSRATLRVEKTNARSLYREKKEEEERQAGKVNKLKSILGSLQRHVSQLKARRGFVKKRSSLMSDQLGDKKIELQLMLQRANMHEETLKKGELAIQQKKEDIRAIKIQCADAERYVNAKKSIQANINERRVKITELQEKLTDEKKQITSLGGRVENMTYGEDNGRWRDLKGEDLDKEQLFAKSQILLQRLSDNKEQLIEREVILEELVSQKSLIGNEVDVTKIKTQPAIKKLNDCQSRVREVTRSMMALISELSMYQATVLKLEEQKETQEEQLLKAKECVSCRQPPSIDAVNELNRVKRRRKQTIQDLYVSVEVDPRAHENEFGKLYYPAKYALRTTAEPRPSAYIPDVGIEVPKPYGGMAPFKPGDCDEAMMRRLKGVA